jgi:ribonuclease Z
MLSAQILGTFTPDSTPSILITSDSAKFLFNVGEGSQRFCTEHKIRLSKLKHIFLSHLNTDTVGGLPGMILTLADVGVKNIAISGPMNLASYIYSLRHFVRRWVMKFSSVYNTNNMTCI